VESTDSGEKIDELIDGLLGHALPNQNSGEIGSHKWTPVHPGERPPYPHILGESDSRRLASRPKAS
jgi:hypothetical protein